MTTIATRLALAMMLALPALPTAAQTRPRIGIVAPQAGNYEVLGRQILAGAKLAADDKAELVMIEETCADGSGIAIAEALVSAGVKAAAGFLCTVSLEGGLARLAQAGIPAITLSVRSPILMEDARKKAWPLFRLAPSANAERDKLVETVGERWKDKAFAILDDGTINNHELADAIRVRLEEMGMKAAMVDSFRPAQDVQAGMIRRLAKASVTHVLAIGERGDIAILARDAKAQKRDMVFLGGEQLEAVDTTVALEAGVLAVTLGRPSGNEIARSVETALAKEDGLADGYVLPAHAAVSLALEAIEIAGATDSPVEAALVDTQFATAIGPVRFGPDHELATNPFALMRWTGTAFEPVAPLSESN
jgi:branched-chain amino acid transport system substrate-binding protein